MARDVGTLPAHVTIREVAAEAGVSIATASKALNDTGRMTEETRERVKAVAARLGFRPNGLAKGLLAKRSFTVGLLTNDTYGRFTLPVMQGVSEALVDHGVSTFLCSIEDDPETGRNHVETMLDKRVDGIIASGKRIDRGLPVDLSNLPVPVVHVVSQNVPGAVVFHPDDAQGAREAVSRLVSLGRKRIVHITGPESFAAVHLRADAFRAVAGADAPVFAQAWSEAWGYETIRRLWASPATRPDGVFCGNDQIARGVVDGLRELGASVPEDVSVIGFDNWEIFATQTRPPLTTIDMNLKELGRQAGLTVLAMAERKPVASGLRKLPCTLVVRQSCGGEPRG